MSSAAVIITRRRPSSSPAASSRAWMQVWNTKSRECIGDLDLKPYAEEGLKLHGHSLDYVAVAEIGAEVLRALNIGSSIQGESLPKCRYINTGMSCSRLHLGLTRRRPRCRRAFGRHH